MIYRIILGVISITFMVWFYTESGFTEPLRTLIATVFLILAVSIFLDNTVDDAEVNDD